MDATELQYRSILYTAKEQFSPSEPGISSWNTGRSQDVLMAFPCDIEPGAYLGMRIGASLGSREG